MCVTSHDREGIQETNSVVARIGAILDLGVISTWWLLALCFLLVRTAGTVTKECRRGHKLRGREEE